MQTIGGLRIQKLEARNGLHYVTWDGYHSGRKTQTLQYFPDQTFDMADRPQSKGETNMAQRVNITVESDLSGDADASPVTFGLDGTEYAIDLTDKEAGALRKALAPYVGAAKPVKGSRKRSAAPSNSGGPSPKAIREWARENTDLEVPDRGRIPAEVREAYTAAHA
jgi:hypothetical protein